METIPSPSLGKCLFCEKALHGRVDKQFCNDYCRSAFHNKFPHQPRMIVKKINTILQKNRRILEKTLDNRAKALTISKHALFEMGFNFNYFTHIDTQGKRGLYYFCYDYGYKEVENRVQIVKRD